MSDKAGDFEKKFRKIKLERDATIHMNFNRYRDALEVLPEVRTLQSDDDVAAKIYFLAMECECHLRLQEDSSASVVIQEIVKILTHSTAIPDEVITMAKSFKDEELHIRAYILYYAACKLYMLKTANDAARKIKSTFDDMKEMAEAMAKYTSGKEVLLRHMIPSMKKLLEDLVGMPDNGSHEKIELEAWCYYDVAHCYGYLKDDDQEVAMNEAGIKLMKEKLGGDAEKYKITGRCYNNVGVAYFYYKCGGKRREAKEALQTALRVLKNAIDFVDENERQRDIGLSVENNSVDGLVIILHKLSMIGNEPTVLRM